MDVAPVVIMLLSVLLQLVVLASETIAVKLYKKTNRWTNLQGTLHFFNQSPLETQQHHDDSED
jgi:hypothetical protein